MKSSVEQRQFQIEWDWDASFLQGIALALRISALGWSEYHAWQTFLHSELLELCWTLPLRHFFWDSSGVLTMFLGSGWLNFSCQFRGVWPWRPSVGVSLVPAWFCLAPIVGTQMLSPNSIVHMNSWEGQIVQRLPVSCRIGGVHAGDVEVDGQRSLTNRQR